MGVKGFGKWLKNRYPTAFKPTQRRPYDYVYVDMNSLLHCAARYARSEAALQSQTRRYLRDIYRLYCPGKRMFLAIDGPASLVKVEEQRRRRKDCSIIAQRTGRVDAQQFTPGCTLMARLEMMLIQFAQELSNRIGFTPPVKHTNIRGIDNWEFVLSGNTVPGEGEVKIFQELALLRTRGATHAILTTDSDAYLQAIGHAIPQVFIIPPPWDTGKIGDILFTDHLLHLLQDEANCHGVRDSKQILTDFCFLVALSGNDYLPALQFGSYMGLWPLYCQHKDIRLIDLTRGGELRFNDLQRLLNHWYTSDCFIPHQGLQQRLLAAYDIDQEAQLDRIAKFLMGALAITRQICGRESPTSIMNVTSVSYSAGTDCQANGQVQTRGDVKTPTNYSPTLSIRYPYSSAPSVGEFIQALQDPTALIQCISRITEQTTSLPSLCPITAPIMLLEPVDRSLIYLPEPIRPLAREFWSLQLDRGWLNSESALKWLIERVQGLLKGGSLEPVKEVTSISQWVRRESSRAISVAAAMSFKR